MWFLGGMCIYCMLVRPVLKSTPRFSKVPSPTWFSFVLNFHPVSVPTLHPLYNTLLHTLRAAWIPAQAMLIRKTPTANSAIQPR